MIYITIKIPGNVFILIQDIVRIWIQSCSKVRGEQKSKVMRYGSEIAQQTLNDLGREDHTWRIPLAL